MIGIGDRMTPAVTHWLLCRARVVSVEQGTSAEFANPPRTAGGFACRPCSVLLPRYPLSPCCDSILFWRRLRSKLDPLLDLLRTVEDTGN